MATQRMALSASTAPSFVPRTATGYRGVERRQARREKQRGLLWFAAVSIGVLAQVMVARGFLSSQLGDGLASVFLLASFCRDHSLAMLGYLARIFS